MWYPSRLKELCHLLKVLELIPYGQFNLWIEKNILTVRDKTAYSQN